MIAAGGGMEIVMRIERLEGDRKIRVSLSEDDLNEMNINIKTMTPDSPELHRFLFRIMEYIKKETGFTAEHGQVMVEASPRDDGVILTVTRIEPKSETVRRNIRTLKAKRKAVAECTYIYRFHDFESMCSYLKLCEVADAEAVRIYEYENVYYLYSMESLIYITEFADTMPPYGMRKGFLEEHASIVATGEKLENMIEELK